MNQRVCLALCALLVALSVSSGVAFAQGEAVQAAEAEMEAAVGEVWTEPSGTSTAAFGLANGIYGGAFAQELRLRLNFDGHWGMMIKALAHHYLPGDYRYDVGGKLGVFGGTDPMLNILRVYGGGGIHTLLAVVGSEETDLRVGMGGHVGLEAFLGHDFSFFVEIGGGGNFMGSQSGAGGTALGGMNFYL